MVRLLCKLGLDARSRGAYRKSFQFHNTQLTAVTSIIIYMLKPVALILLALFAFSILYIPAPFHERAAFACECIAPKPTEQALTESAAVFSGKVEHITTLEEQYIKLVTLSVDEAWKGMAQDKGAILVVTGIDEGGCGYGFEEGKSYLVYAHARGDNEPLGVSLCSRTTSIDQAESDLAILGAGYVPAQKPPTPEMLEECKELGMAPEKCSEEAILGRVCLGMDCGSTGTSQIDVLQNPTMLTLFGLLAAGIGGAGAVFYIKSRKGSDKKESDQ